MGVKCDAKDFWTFFERDGGPADSDLRMEIVVMLVITLVITLVVMLAVMLAVMLVNSCCWPKSCKAFEDERSRIALRRFLKISEDTMPPRRVLIVY